MNGNHSGGVNTKKVLFAYILITLMIAWILEYLFVFQNRTFIFMLWKVSFFPLMMTPAVIALLFLLLVPGYRIWDIGFRPGGLDNLLIAVIYPFLFVGAIAGSGLVTGLAVYAPQVPNAMSYLASNLVNLPIILILALPSILGEEIGWRGFLLKKALIFGRRRAALTASVVWMLFHLIVALKPPAGSIGWLWSIGFLLNIFFAGIFFAWLYIRSGSVWPVFLLHLIWNFLNPLVLGNVYQNAASRLFKANIYIVNGEGLLGCCLSLIVAATILWSWRRPDAYESFPK